jgi:hypothetical protein
MSETPSNILPFKARTTKPSTDPLANWYKLIEVNMRMIAEALERGQMVHLKPMKHHDRNGTPYQSIRIIEGL